jgi:hypothetical protein
LTNQRKISSDEISPKKIGFLFGAGIIVFPFVFAWFTLRRGFGQVARFVSLGWMAVITAMVISSMISSAAETRLQAEMEIAAKSSGFDSVYEMETLQKQGFKTKIAFETYVSKTPISPPEGDYAAECYGAALVWNKYSLDEKAGIIINQPIDLTDGLDEILNDYTTDRKKQSYEYVSARQEYYQNKFERLFSIGGINAIVPKYSACKGKLGRQILEKQRLKAAGEAEIQAEERNEALNARSVASVPLDEDRRSSDNDPSPVKTAPQWVSDDYDNCRKIADADSVWFNDVAGELGISPSNIKILGGNPTGRAVTGSCAVTLSSPLGIYVCGYADMYTSDGGKTTFVKGRGLGYDGSCYKPK